MELYLAIPKAIIDINENGTQEKSDALGMFCVKPLVKKSLLGKTEIIGFQEVITGEKIANRRYYMDYLWDGVVSKDVDAMRTGTPQVGDVSWEIVEKATADRLLSPEELQKYMSLSPEEVCVQLQKVRAEAIKLGQENTDLKTDSYDSTASKTDSIYVAIPRAITDISKHGEIEISGALGMFCVKPLVKKSLFGKTKVVGFQEVITGEKIANRRYYMDYLWDVVVSKDVDSARSGVPQVGDVSWKIVEKATADRLLSSEELARYMSLMPEEIKEQLQSIRDEAIKLGQSAQNYTERNR